MDLKKELALPEQFPWPRRKVLSGFGLVVSFLVLAVLLLSHFLKGPPVQGFLSVTVNNSPTSTSSNGNVNVDDAKGPVLVNNHLSNFTEEVKNGSFIVEQGRFEEKKGIEGSESFSAKEDAVTEKTIASTSLGDIGSEDNIGNQNSNDSLGNIFDKEEKKRLIWRLVLEEIRVRETV